MDRTIKQLATWEVSDPKDKEEEVEDILDLQMRGSNNSAQGIEF